MGSAIESIARLRSWISSNLWSVLGQLFKMGNMMSEDYDWSADIAKLPMAVLLVFADSDLVSDAYCGVLRAFGRREGAGLAESLPGWRSCLATAIQFS
jgi:hypothetical protein